MRLCPDADGSDNDCDRPPTGHHQDSRRDRDDSGRCGTRDGLAL